MYYIEVENIFHTRINCNSIDEAVRRAERISVKYALPVYLCYIDIEEGTDSIIDCCDYGAWDGREDEE